MLLTTDDDDPTATARRVERALQTAATAVVVVFLGTGVWGFQLLWVVYGVDAGRFESAHADAVVGM